MRRSTAIPEPGGHGRAAALFAESLPHCAGRYATMYRVPGCCPELFYLARSWDFLVRQKTTSRMGVPVGASCTSRRSRTRANLTRPDQGFTLAWTLTRSCSSSLVTTSKPLSWATPGGASPNALRYNLICAISILSSSSLVVVRVSKA